MERKLYHMVGVPTLKSLKIIVSYNIIQNFSVTVEYIEIEEKIFGPDVSTLKGRTTIQRKKVVVDDFIKISREMIYNNQELSLCMGIMLINKYTLLKFFTKT